MPVFRIHRMKEAPRQQFRWAPHVSGSASVKPKDYDAEEEIDAENEYAAWVALREKGTALQVGDLLETPEGELRLCKYVGFEDAKWFLPSPPPPQAAPPATPEIPSPTPA
jgi:hypothetical protein